MDLESCRESSHPVTKNRLHHQNQCAGTVPFSCGTDVHQKYTHCFVQKHLLKYPKLLSVTFPHTLGLVRSLCFRKVYAEGKTKTADNGMKEEQKRTAPTPTSDSKQTDETATKSSQSEGVSPFEGLSSTATQRIYFEMIARSQIERETGMERVKMMFQKNHRGESSQEMEYIKLALLQVCGISFFLKYIPSFSLAKKDFIRENRATVFRTRIEAARRMQDYVTLVAAREAAAFSAKMTFFSAGVLFGSQMISSYRNKSSVSDYIIAAGFTGGLARLSFGLKGMIAGTSVGSILGLFLGGLAVLVMNVYGFTQEERHLEVIISKLQHERAIIGETAFQKKANEVLGTANLS